MPHSITVAEAVLIVLAIRCPVADPGPQLQTEAI